MKSKTLLVSAAMAGLFTGTVAVKAASTVDNHGAAKAGINMPTSEGETHSCKGKNSCKGKGGCSSGDNGCKGKNSCKGKGGCSTEPKKE
jgi:hypothetical protein